MKSHRITLFTTIEFGDPEGTLEESTAAAKAYLAARMTEPHQFHVLKAEEIQLPDYEL